MPHDAYYANVLRQKALNHMSSGELQLALTAAEKSIQYSLKSLPVNPLADTGGVDAQALFDWALGLMSRGMVHRHLKHFEQAEEDLDLAEIAMLVIQTQFPMPENLSAYALIRHNRSNLRSDMRNFHGAGEDATVAIEIRRQLATSDPGERDLLAGSLKGRSGVFLVIGPASFALRDAEEAVAIRRSALAPTADPANRQTFAMTLYSLALAYERSEEKMAAREAIKEAIGILTELSAKFKVPSVETDLRLCRVLAARI